MVKWCQGLNVSCYWKDSAVALAWHWRLFIPDSSSISSEEGETGVPFTVATETRSSDMSVGPHRSVRRNEFQTPVQKGKRCAGWKPDISIRCTCPTAVTYHVMPTSGAFRCWHKFSLTFPSNPVAPQGFTDVLKGKGRSLVLQMVHTPVINYHWEQVV